MPYRAQPNHQPTIYHSSKYANPPSFLELKDRVLSNARAIYAHTFPNAERFDVISSRMVLSRDLHLSKFQVALIVYPDPTSHNWRVLHKSAPYSSVEDAAFEVYYWTEQDLKPAMGKLEVGDTWAATVDLNASKQRQAKSKGTSAKAHQEIDEREDEAGEVEPAVANDAAHTVGMSDAPVQIIATGKRKMDGENEQDDGRKKGVKMHDKERVFVKTGSGLSDRGRGVASEKD